MRGVDFPDSIKDFLNGGLGFPHVGMNKKLIQAVFQLTDEQMQNRQYKKTVIPDADFNSLQQ